MEQNKKEYKERINYVKEKYESSSKVSYTGQSVNYGCVCSSWESIEDLRSNMKAMIDCHLQWSIEEMAKEDPLEMHECTLEEWYEKDLNIDYWEIERVKTLLKRPSIQKKWKEIIGKELKKSLYADHGDLTESIIQALIEQPNE